MSEWRRTRSQRSTGGPAISGTEESGRIEKAWIRSILTGDLVDTQSTRYRRLGLHPITMLSIRHGRMIMVKGKERATRTGSIIYEASLSCDELRWEIERFKRWIDSLDRSLQEPCPKIVKFHSLWDNWKY